MANIAENVNQAIADFDSIKEAIEDKGVEVGNAPTSQYASKIAEIPSGGAEAFYSVDGRCCIANVVLPETVTSIGAYAYQSCTGLTHFTISDSVTSIGNNAFSGCSSLESINLPNSVTSIGGNAFYNCSSLTTLDIPSSVTSIGSNVFFGCSSLESINLPNSVTSIGGNAFLNCKSLTTLNIPSSVTSIGNNAFSGCSNFENITLGQDFNCTLSLSASTKYSVDTMVAMFEALKDLTGQTAKTLTLGATNLAKLTAEQKQIATSKNWNLA